MRCLALAAELKKHNMYICFICRNLPKSLYNLVEKNKHDLIVLKHVEDIKQQDELKHSFFLGTSQATDAIDTIEAISDKSWDWLIIDHYAIDNRFEMTLKKYVERIMVIDDIADRQHECDVLLDQNLYADMDERYVEKVPASCAILLGPEYALLRNEFACLHNKIKPRTGVIEKILVFFGGVDPENLTSLSINAINNLCNEKLHVDVVVGTAHPYRHEIESVCKSLNYSCHVQTERMAELMAESDLAIGAGGSASWERCCLGLATISVAFADNQYAIAKQLDRVGASIFLGNHHSVSQTKIEDAMSELILDRDRVKSMSSTAYSIVDGNGTKRVCEILNQFQ